jgi:hypothetical protein
MSRHSALAATCDGAIKPIANIAPWHKASVRKFLGEIVFHLVSQTLFSPTRG